MVKNKELETKLESNEFETMWELVYDILMKISGKLYESENFEKVFSPYILCRYISMKTSLIDFAELLNIVNTNSKLTKKQFYLFAYSLIPKQHSSFIKYIKKQQKIKSKDESELTFIDTDIHNNIFEL